MELTDQNKDDVLNIIYKGMEQEMLLQVAKEQAGLREGTDIILFLSFYDGKYTITSVTDGKKYWGLTAKGKEFVNKGGFSGQGDRDIMEKRILYGIVIVLIIVVVL